MGVFLKGYLLDTNVFNHIVEGKVLLSNLPSDQPFYVTHLQYDEIAACSDNEKKRELEKCLTTISMQRICTSTGVWGVSKWGGFKWGGEGSRLHRDILSELNSKNRRRHDANLKDALIGATAIKNGCTLITHDQQLGKIVKSLGGKAYDHRSQKHF